jgi:predicted small secreted protein
MDVNHHFLSIRITAFLLCLINEKHILQMKRLIYMALFLTAITLAGCQKNYYSGTGKGSNCGCPSKKGMVGY